MSDEQSGTHPASGNTDADLGSDIAPDGLQAELMRMAEAAIFAAEEPVTLEDLADIYARVTGLEPPALPAIGAAIDALNRQYEAHGHALRVRAWGGGFRLSTIHEVAPYLKALLHEDRQRRLSRSLMETLAILAYRQPATKPELDFVRGVDCDYAIRKLLELGLADVVGRSEAVGRPLLYGTTPKFLEAFGLDALDSLPNLREVEDMLADPQFNRERARLLVAEGLRADTDATGHPDAVAQEPAESDDPPDERDIDERDADDIHGTT